MNKLRFALLPVVVLVAGLVLAGCGGGSSTAELTSNDVAVVGDTQISKSQLKQLMATAKDSYKSKGQKFPKQGTAEYATVQGQAVTLLVQQAEREEKAADLGVTVTKAQIAKRLKQIKKQYFGGKESTYRKQLKQQGLTDAQVRQDIREQLISEGLYTKITKDVKVTDADVHAYYVAHKTDYTQPKSREVRHILVKKKALAEKLYGQLQHGADFAALAKKYSTDKATAVKGGKYLAVKGQSVAPFDKAAFSLKLHEISKPVHSTYGWHVIQAIGPIEPPKTTPEKKVASQIKAQLLQSKQQDAVNAWSQKVQKDFCGSSEIKYRAGYQPSPDPCTATSTSATTTG